MGFEAPLALLALAAAGLPIVAHLLRRQDLPRRRLPTLVLLQRAEAASRKRVRLVDLLLLIVRVALIVCFALALGKPFWRVALAYGDGSVASVVLVIDDSMSMHRTGAGGDLVAEAAERAREVVESLPEGSEVALVLAGAPARLELSRTDRLDTAERAIADRVRASARGTDLATAMSLADRELAGARHAARRVVVLTDAAAHSGLGDLRLPSGVAVQIERLGAEAPTANAAIVDARATPDPTTPGRLSVAVDVRARELDGRQLELVLRRGDDALAQQALTIAQGGARATLHATLDPENAAAELVLAAEDAIATDDRRGLALRAPAGARVLLVEGDAPAGVVAHGRFVARAIDLAPEEGGALTRRRVDPETFAAMELGDVDVVVLSNVPAPSDRVARRLAEHVERGGGLWIAPGQTFDARAYAARLGALLPARPTAPRDQEIEGPHAVAGSELFPDGGTGLEQSRTRRRIGLEDVEVGAEPLLQFADGSPALLSVRRGDGQVALMATTLDDAWTDLPYRPGYLPLVANLLRQLAPTGRAPQSAVLPGAPVVLDAPAGAVRLEIVTPDGERVAFSGDALEERITFESTHAPGVYRVQVAARDRALSEEPRLAFVVASPAEESDLTPGRVPSDAGGEEGARADTSVVHRPLAPWLFLLVGLLAVAEAALRLRAVQVARRAS